MDLGARSLKSQMRQAERLGAPWVVIVGPQEWEREAAAVRDMRAPRPGRGVALPPATGAAAPCRLSCARTHYRDTWCGEVLPAAGGRAGAGRGLGAPAP